MSLKVNGKTQFNTDLTMQLSYMISEYYD